VTEDYLEGTQGPYRNLVDYILGITHEIWESRQVERIHDYYASNTLIYTLGGMVQGAAAIVRNTQDTLAAFPDRLLLGESVVWSRESAGVFYSSHRILSPMTNLGASGFGPATGRKVQVRTIADCLVENGVITREWLVRDNFSLVRQLGFDVHAIARTQALRPLAPEFAEWCASERSRVIRGDRAQSHSGVPWGEGQSMEFAKSVLGNVWCTGDRATFELHFAPYAVLHDSMPVASGRAALFDEYATLRTLVGDAAVTVDHLCVVPNNVDGYEVAARWTLSGQHQGDAWGLAASGSPLLVLGVTHWQIVAGRIAAEWTIFDKLAVLTQIYRQAKQ
jgi:predicted ester cyclase